MAKKRRKRIKGKGGRKSPPKSRKRKPTFARSQIRPRKIVVPKSDVIGRRTIEFDLKKGRTFRQSIVPKFKEIDKGIRELGFGEEGVAGQWRAEIEFHTAWRDKSGRWRSQNGNFIKRPKYARDLRHFPKRRKAPDYGVDRRTLSFGITSDPVRTGRSVGDQIHLEGKRLIQKVIDSTKLVQKSATRATVRIHLESATFEQSQFFRERGQFRKMIRAEKKKARKELSQQARRRKVDRAQGYK